MDSIVDNLEDDKGRKWFTPLKIILSLFLIFLMFVLIFPEYSVKLDPEPNMDFSVSDVVPNEIEIIDQAIQPESYSEFRSLVKPNDPVIKQTADKIASISCEGNKICNAKAMFYFVRDNFDYVNDPAEYEYVKSARESLVVKVGDCDDASVLLVNLLSAVGIETRMVFIPKHVFVQLRIDDYKQGKWLNLDPTCKNCKFNELPYQDSKEILEIV
tara:strand:- start:6222 stop:6863 length:642 start_codon:yes stop_codon:yes gene_type:complete